MRRPRLSVSGAKRDAESRDVSGLGKLFGLVGPRWVVKIGPRGQSRSRWMGYVEDIALMSIEHEQKPHSF